MSTIFPLHSYYPLHNLLLMRVCVCECVCVCVFSAPHQLIASPLAKQREIKDYFWNHICTVYLLADQLWHSRALLKPEGLREHLKKSFPTCKGEVLRLSFGILPFLHWPGIKLNWQYNSDGTKSSTLLNTFQWSHWSSSELQWRADTIGERRLEQREKKKYFPLRDDPSNVALEN